MTRTLLIIAACVGIFLSGAIAGGFVAIRNLDKLTHRRAADQFTQQHFRRLAEQLDLTDDQRQKIRPLLLRAGRDLQDTRRRATAIVERLEVDVKQELTPEQREKFEKLRIRLRSTDRPLPQRPLRDGLPRSRSGAGEGTAPEKMPSSNGGAAKDPAP